MLLGVKNEKHLNFVCNLNALIACRTVEHNGLAAQRFSRQSDSLPPVKMKMLPEGLSHFQGFA